MKAPVSLPRRLLLFGIAAILLPVRRTAAGHGIGGQHAATLRLGKLIGPSELVMSLGVQWLAAERLTQPRRILTRRMLTRLGLSARDLVSLRDEELRSQIAAVVRTEREAQQLVNLHGLWLTPTEGDLIALSSLLGA